MLIHIHEKYLDVKIIKFFSRQIRYLIILFPNSFTLQRIEKIGRQLYNLRILPSGIMSITNSFC